MAEMISLCRDGERRTGLQIDLIFQIGDFEPHRHEGDLKTMAAPAKYRHLGDFPSVFGGAIELPWPVFFIGGNHEPYGFLDQHQDGVEICTHCTYLGRAFAGEIHGLNVCALSGIFNTRQFERPLPPLDGFGKVSNKAYTYFRESHVEHLLARESADILLLHDWPKGAIAEQDRQDFELQGRSQRYLSVGNEWARLLVEQLRPSLVVAGHMHRSYRSRFIWGQEETLFVALGKVDFGPKAVALFQLKGGLFKEIDTA